MPSNAGRHLGIRRRSLWCARRQTSVSSERRLRWSLRCAQRQTPVFGFQWWCWEQRLTPVWIEVFRLFRCRSGGSCSCAFLNPLFLGRPVLVCGSWRTAPEWWLCHFDISRRNMGNLQAVNGNPFGSGAKLDVEPFVILCDDSIGTCVGCLEGFLCFGPANVNILSRLQCLGYVKPCCLCTMRAGRLGPKAFYLGS